MAKEVTGIPLYLVSSSLYLKIDVLLVAEFVEEFRDLSRRSNWLDQAH